MEIVIIALVSFVASGLTFFSGFGLGTLLTPVFAIYFELDIAIAMTAIVHFLNNLFKLKLTFDQIDRETVIKFGIPSFFGALIGAFLLVFLANSQHVLFKMGLIPVYSLKFIFGILLIFFGLMEILPALKRIQFGKKYLIPGGLISGFFGGLSGHQGAIRSAFLIKSGLNKESFIASGIAIACLIDLSRLSLYASHLQSVSINWNYILIASLSAFTGAYAGNKYLKKITLDAIKWIVGLALLTIAFALILNVI
jgi:uncharacterized membrane protein YfcA